MIHLLYRLSYTAPFKVLPYYTGSLSEGQVA